VLTIADSTFTENNEPATTGGQTYLVYNDGYTAKAVIKNSKFKEDFSPVDKDCACYLCKNFSRSYLHHLFRTDDDTATLEALSPSNLLIVFGFARYNARQVAQIKLMRQRGFRIVCVTDSPDSPFIPLTDYHFILPADSFDFNTSMISGMAFIEALALALGMQREKLLFSRIHALDVDTQETNMFW